MRRRPHSRGRRREGPRAVHAARHPPSRSAGRTCDFRPDLRRYASRRAGRARPVRTTPGRKRVRVPGKKTSSVHRRARRRERWRKAHPFVRRGAHSLRLHRRVAASFAFGRAKDPVASALVFLEDASSAAALTTSAKARLVAATPPGAVLGALAACAADTRGRKRTLLDVAGAAYARSARALLRADRPERPPGVSAPRARAPARGRGRSARA